MFFAILSLSILIPSISALSIGTVSDQNVLEPQANASEFFPDWVPFKNKRGEDLGEFVQVETKPKPKKRLAPPVNFILRPVAELGDDYYDKEQGESDGEDFDKKEWSNVDTPANDAPVNHTAISDIDGVVEIITKKPNDILLETLNKGILKKDDNTSENSKEDAEEKRDKQNDTKEEKIKEKTNVEPESTEDDYDDESSGKNKTETETAEQIEAEAKKARILDSVDQLKERHAEEQRMISEKIKEEELLNEERQRDKIGPIDHQDKYNIRRKSKQIAYDYDDYNEGDSTEEKYKLSREHTTPEAPKRTTKKKKNKSIESGKLSVFRNPRVFMVNDDDEEVTTFKPAKTTKRGKAKFSSKFQSTPKPEPDESERISLLPDTNSKEGEPALFFPKKRKGKKKTKTTTPTSDSTVAETIPGRTAKQLSTLDTTGYTTAIAVDTQVVGDVTATVGDTSDAAPSASDSRTEVKDAIPASSDHKKETPKIENYSQERESGKEYHSDHEEEHAEHGKKAYKGYHEDTKTAKGHHDKENRKDKYDDQGKVTEDHHEEAGHYGAHHHEEHGKKHAKYEESGKHSKGHSTKGSHDIHKKEEYEKKVEFFEEEGDSADEEKHGGYNDEKEHSSGGHFKKGNLKAGHHHHDKGESGHFGKGGHVHVHKGHKSAEGEDGHGQQAGGFYKKQREASGKKWVYHHGHPAKTANLVVIDRRGDRYFHGPQYYG